MSVPLGFLASNTYLATRNLKFWTEIEPGCGEDLFFGLHLNLGKKFPTEIELLSLTKLRKNLSPLRNLLNPQKLTPMQYAHIVSSKFIRRISIHNSKWFVPTPQILYCSSGWLYCSALQFVPPAPEILAETKTTIFCIALCFLIFLL